jgi:hypothetical protein
MVLSLIACLPRQVRHFTGEPNSMLAGATADFENISFVRKDPL